jgi:hypothetical protein
MSHIKAIFKPLPDFQDVVANCVARLFQTCLGSSGVVGKSLTLDSNPK